MAGVAGRALTAAEQAAVNALAGRVASLGAAVVAASAVIDQPIDGATHQAMMAAMGPALAAAADLVALRGVVGGLEAISAFLVGGVVGGGIATAAYAWPMGASHAPALQRVMAGAIIYHRLRVTLLPAVAAAAALPGLPPIVTVGLVPSQEMGERVLYVWVGEGGREKGEGQRERMVRGRWRQTRQWWCRSLSATHSPALFLTSSASCARPQETWVRAWGTLGAHARTSATTCSAPLLRGRWPCCRSPTSHCANISLHFGSS